MREGEDLRHTYSRHCVDNGAMIVYAGLLAYGKGFKTTLEDTTFAQRFRTDEVEAIWRGDEMLNSNGPNI